MSMIEVILLAIIGEKLSMGAWYWVIFGIYAIVKLFSILARD